MSQMNPKEVFHKTAVSSVPTTLHSRSLPLMLLRNPSERASFGKEEDAPRFF